MPLQRSVGAKCSVLHLRQQLPALETAWKTSRWPNRVFAFLLVITEVNVFCAYKSLFQAHNNASEEYYEDHIVFSFRNILAEVLIEHQGLQGIYQDILCLQSWCLDMPRVLCTACKRFGHGQVNSPD